MKSKGFDPITIGIIFEIARIKSEGHKYEDVKRGLKHYYDTRVNPDYSYEELEKEFDQAWGGVIEVIPKEKLK